MSALIISRPLHALLLLALTCFALSTGCKKNKPDDALISLEQRNPGVVSTASIPDTSKGRIETLAARLPSTTQFTFMTGELSQARAMMNTIAPIASKLQGYDIRIALADELGFDLLDTEAWRNAGVPQNSAIALSYVQNRAVFMVFVEDQAKFDAAITDGLTRMFGAGTAPLEREMNGRTIRWFEEERGQQVAWLHDGKLAIIATSISHQDLATPQDLTAPDFIDSLTMTLKTESAASSKAFDQFKQGINPEDQAIFGYIDSKAIRQDEKLLTKLKADPEWEDLIAMIEEDADTLGLGMSQDADGMTYTALLGGSPDHNATMKAIGEPLSTFPFTSLATQDVMVGSRIALNPQKSWLYMLDSLPTQERNELLGNVTELNRELSINVERDVIQELTGQGAFFLYGFDLAKLMSGGGSPNAVFQALNMAFALEFRDAAKLRSLASTVASKARLSPVTKKDIIAYTIPDDMGSLYIKENKLFYRSVSLPEVDMLAHMNTTSSKPLIDSDAGADFAKEEPLGGVYVNIDKLHAITSFLIADTPGNDVLGMFEDIALTTDETEAGPTLTLRVAFSDEMK